MTEGAVAGQDGVEVVDAVIVGAGPCGLAAAIAFKHAGLRAVVVDRGCVASGIALYPPYMTFFSTAERISIGGVPFVVAAEKPTRRDALAYYRTLVSHFDLEVRQYEEVVGIETLAGDGRDGAGRDVTQPDAASADDPMGAGDAGGAAGGAGRAVREGGAPRAAVVAAGGGGRAGRMTALGAASEVVAELGGPPPDYTMGPIVADGVTRIAAGGSASRAPVGGRMAPSAAADGARFVVRSRRRSGRECETRARSVVVATGYFGTPSLLGVPGETLPHVTHYFTEGHYGFRQDVVVVGGGNSAVDAALDLYRAGARVTMVHFGPELDPNIKPWVMPDIANRIKEGAIGARFRSRVTAIEPEAVVIRTAAAGDPAEGAAGREERLPADHVFLATGFLPNTKLLEQLGVPLDPASGVPAHDAETMETSVPGVFIAGVIASGYNANRIFIENGRDHGVMIAATLTGSG